MRKQQTRERTMGMTITEKILAAHADRPSVAVGENVWCRVDVLMTHDVCGPGTIGIFEEQFGRDGKVFDPEKIVIIPDHYIFTADAKAHRNVDILRDFAKRQGIRHYYDPDFMPPGRGHAQPLHRSRSRPATGASATSPCPRAATRGPASCCWAPTATPAPTGRSASSPRASATPRRPSSWARASCG